MEASKTVKYGEIYLCDLGTHTNPLLCGHRMALVIQDNHLNNSIKTTMVAIIANESMRKYLPTHVFLTELAGTATPMVMLEQVTSVCASQFISFVGKINNIKLLNKIRIAQKKANGLWHYDAKETDDVRCLCSSCLNEYLSTGLYSYEVINPFATSKERCDRCINRGIEIVLKKRPDTMQGCVLNNRTFEVGGKNE